MRFQMNAVSESSPLKARGRETIVHIIILRQVTRHERANRQRVQRRRNRRLSGIIRDRRIFDSSVVIDMSTINPM